MTTPSATLGIRTVPAYPERRRALFYVFDGGSGIGHLRRLARIADVMQERFSCLIVTGHDAAPQWIVPHGCEYVRLPAWDSLIPSKAQYWGRTTFLDATLDEAVGLRRSIIEGVVRGFRPDVLIVDHLPLGAHEELAPILKTTHCLKCLVTRGIQNETEDLQRLVLGGPALDSLRHDYDRIFSAIDPGVFDLKTNYELPPQIADKILSVGYVAPERKATLRADTRTARGIANDALWVVASAGSGQWGEPLIEACLALVERYPDVCFDIVMGPRSRMRHTGDQALRGTERVRLHSTCSSLDSMHASADLVITCGGYNTLLETIQGGARILCIPYRTDARDEPLHHATILRRFVDIRVAADIDSLLELFEEAIADCRSGPARDRRAALDMGGAERISRTIRSDLDRH
ncbi:glycosyltransferase [Marilutibacter chinensis]|uniref:Glycosyl transferase family 28 C-terminal domain-containing protein n=1 Tax=Marilutibacter chinensis TaxID=2912247 RepID=A0ABS9HY33_9GAMM|nr:glycosyltransferase [Lysobacter chinensis]MCF7223776.1 hypothetical protein [Lysobacter chinensis]